MDLIVEESTGSFSVEDNTVHVAHDETKKSARRMTPEERGEVNKLVNEGRVPVALAFLDELIAERPGDYTPYYRRAGLIIKYGAPENRIPEAERFIAKFPELAQPIAMLGYAYFKVGRFEDAIREYDRSEAMGLSSEIVNPHRDRARRAIERRNQTTVSSSVDSSSGLRPTDQGNDASAARIQEAREQSKRLVSEGKIIQADALWFKLSKNQPNDPEIASAYTWFTLENLPRSSKLSAARRYAARFPDNSDSALVLAEAFFQLRKTDRALLQLDKSEARFGPSDWSISKRIQILSAARGAEAKAVRNTAAREGRNVVWSGVIADPPKTERQLLDVVQGLRDLHQDPVGIQRFAARWYAENGQPDQAIQSFEEAISLQQSDYWLTIEIARIEWALGRRKEALARLEATFEKYPANNVVARELFVLQRRAFKPFAIIRTMFLYVKEVHRAFKSIERR
jgi:tetratricopeptide (TPR) repeat protein